MAMIHTIAPFIPDIKWDVAESRLKLPNKGLRMNFDPASRILRMVFASLTRILFGATRTIGPRTKMRMDGFMFFVRSD